MNEELEQRPALIEFARWIDRLHMLIDAGCPLSENEADELISVLAKARNRIDHVDDRRKSHRAKLDAIQAIIKPNAGR